jgi:hypothetical protein
MKRHTNAEVHSLLSKQTKFYYSLEGLSTVFWCTRKLFTLRVRQTQPDPDGRLISRRQKFLYAENSIGFRGRQRDKSVVYTHGCESEAALGDGA